MIEFKILNDDDNDIYEDLLENCSQAVFNHSLKYRKLLRKILTDCDDNYYALYEKDKLISVLPSFKKKGPFGYVINSLPFFGSHGGIINRKDDDSTLILEYINRDTAQKEYFSSTIIESVWNQNKINYNNSFGEILDQRIGQITTLPKSQVKEEIQEKLMDIFHQKTRNMVRKSHKSNLFVEHNNSNETFSSLINIHIENIKSVGGIPKTKEVFDSINQVFDYNQDYRIYTAKLDGKIIAALLIFYFKNTVEYFTPATISEYRSLQPMSLLIFNAMVDSILEKKSTFWNWGGTWLNQDGVYKFKKRFGATDYKYNYHIKCDMGKINDSNYKNIDLLNHYKYFYTIPFNLIES
tara:strand:- start:690 stop:1745 length:1056 start_codon:yes stop_codon:yes gene_type:complete